MLSFAPNPKVIFGKTQKRRHGCALKLKTWRSYWLRPDALTDTRCLKLIGNFLHGLTDFALRTGSTTSDADNGVLIFRVWTRRDRPFLHLRHSLLALLHLRHYLLALLRSPIFTMVQKWSILTALVLFVNSALAAYSPASYYLLKDYQAGTANFFNNFNYFTGSDPSNGFVQFESFLVNC